MKHRKSPRYQNPDCNGCAKTEARTVAKGRDPRLAACAACVERRKLPEPMLGFRLGLERH